jgi:hypothetical protein
MSHSPLDGQLDQVEAQIQELGSCLIAGDPDLLLAAGAKFQQLTVELMQMADQVGRIQLNSPSRTRRIRALSSGLGALRENLLRHSVYVDHALVLLVPATQQKATYAGVRAYGSPVRQSGAFSVLSA